MPRKRMGPWCPARRMTASSSIMQLAVGHAGRARSRRACRCASGDLPRRRPHPADLPVALARPHVHQRGRGVDELGPVQQRRGSAGSGRPAGRPAPARAAPSPPRPGRRAARAATAAAAPPRPRDSARPRSRSRRTSSSGVPVRGHQQVRVLDGACQVVEVGALDDQRRVDARSREPLLEGPDAPGRFVLGDGLVVGHQSRTIPTPMEVILPRFSRNSVTRFPG